MGIYFLKRIETEFERKTNNPKKKDRYLDIQNINEKKNHESSLIIIATWKFKDESHLYYI